MAEYTNSEENVDKKIEKEDSASIDIDEDNIIESRKIESSESEEKNIDNTCDDIAYLKDIISKQREELRLGRERLQLDIDKFDSDRESFRKEKRDFRSGKYDFEESIEQKYIDQVNSEREEKQRYRLNYETEKGLRENYEVKLREIEKSYNSLLLLCPKDEEGRPTFDALSVSKELDDAKLQIEKLEEELLNQKETWWGPEQIKRANEKIRDFDLLNKTIHEKDDEISKLKERQREDTLLEFKLKDHEKVAEGLKQLNEDLQAEIEKINSYYQKNRKGKFLRIKEFDESLPVPINYSNIQISLKEIADHIIKYGETRSFQNIRYRYKKDMICSFLAGLCASMNKSKLIILQGLSGTGKSSLPQLVADALGFASSLIPVQPSWRDRNDLLGFDNDFTGEFKETEFARDVYRASKNPNQVVFIILDEFNLSRIEYYFADFLSTLENPDKSSWRIELALADSSDSTKEFQDLIVTENIWFIGTANIDESTQSITDKVYDRAQIVNFDAVPPENNANVDAIEPLNIGIDTLRRLFNEVIESKEYDLDIRLQTFISNLSEQLEKVNMSYGARVEEQLKSYVPAFAAAYGGDKKKAITIALDVFISTKILYKLDKRFSVKNDEREYYNQIAKLFYEYLGSNSDSYTIIKKFLDK